MNRLAEAARDTVYLISLGYSPMVAAVGLGISLTQPLSRRERGSKLLSPRERVAHSAG